MSERYGDRADRIGDQPVDIRDYKVLSECGQYIAVFLPFVHTLKVFEIETKKLLNSYDVSESVKQHMALKRLPFDIRLGKIAWEFVSSEDSTKVAILVENYAIILVYDVINYSDPVIIEQGSEGIEDFFWIKPLPGSDNTGEGSYVNSKQILVFTRSYLYVKLYSLDCVEIVWKLCKPLSKAPILNPENPNMWSLVLESRSPEVSDQNPIVYHFYNEGSVSKLLYRFKLPNPVYSDYLLTWSNSGKWLIYFNCADTLFGFDLQVFNSLAVNKRQFNLSEYIPTGDPIINVKWMTDGIQGESPLSLGAEKYYCTNVSLDSMTDYVIVLGMEEHSIEIVTVSVKDFRIISRDSIPSFVGAKTWRQHFDGRQLRYVLSRPEEKHLNIKAVHTMKRGDLSYLIVQFTDSVLINEIIVNDPTLSRLIFYKPLHYISTNKIISCTTFNENLVVLTISHVLSFDFKSVSVIYQSPSPVKYAIIGKDTPRIVVLEEEIDEWTLHTPENIPKKRGLPAKNIPSIIQTMGTSFTEENTDTFVNKRVRKN